MPFGLLLIGSPNLPIFFPIHDTWGAERLTQSYVTDIVRPRDILNDILSYKETKDFKLGFGKPRKKPLAPRKF